MVKFVDHAPALVRPAWSRKKGRILLRRLLAAAEVVVEFLVCAICLFGPLVLVALVEAGKR